MANDDPVTMDETELDAFIGPGGTGVLALADEGVPYATPVSYGYDGDRSKFFLRLGFSDASEKERFLDTSTPARLVIYDRNEDRWRSAIAVGTLERLTTGDLSAEVARHLQRGDVPLFDIWGESTEELEFKLFHLDVERLTGRKT